MSAIISGAGPSLVPLENPSPGLALIAILLLIVLLFERELARALGPSTFSAVSMKVLGALSVPLILAFALIMVIRLLDLWR